MLRAHCQTSGWSLAADDPFNNMVRTTIEAMAATRGRHAVAPHQRAGRGAGAADRLLRAHRPQHPAHPPEGGAASPAHRPVGRLVLRRAADLRARRAGAAAHRRGRRARRHGEGDRDGPAAAAHRGGGGADAGADRFRRSRSWSASTATGADAERRSRCCKVDNSAVRAAQVAKLKRLRAERDQAATRAALAALTDAARTGSGNLLAAAIDAARAKATVGEISEALEAAFGRYEAEPKAVAGTYRREIGAADRGVAARDAADRAASAATTGGRHASSSPRSGRTATTAGRRSSPLRSPTSASTSTLGPLFQTPEEAAAPGDRRRRPHRRRLHARRRPPDARPGAEGARWRPAGRPDIMVTVGGVVPQQDWQRAATPASPRSSLPAP